MKQIEERYNYWKERPELTESERAELDSASPDEIADRFYRDLEFGTGGLRGVMELGTNRMNRFIVRRATKGLADFLLAEYGDEAVRRGVAIAYDSRNNSTRFAKEAALTLCAAGVPAKLFDRVAPTPTLSFAVRSRGAVAGIVVTASHNPKEYNGYKVYDASGRQISPACVQKLTPYIQAVADPFGVPAAEERAALDAGLLSFLGEETVDAFVDAALEQTRPLDESAKAALRVVYTPLHGSGEEPVVKALNRLGVDVVVTPEQAEPNGDFPTVASPNPEDAAALEMGVELAKRVDADVVLGTDPDADRVGVAVRQKDGEYASLTGNQIGALIVNYALLRRQDELSPKSTIVKTIVTNELGAEIARKRGCQVVDTLTGFKYIGEQICNYERDAANGKDANVFVAGYEESYGYLVGTHARDKDAVVSSIVICEMAAYYKSRGQTLRDVLEELFGEYGYYLDALDSRTLQGADGARKIADAMKTFRSRGVALASDVVKVVDYANDDLGLPKENVLKFFFEDGSWAAVRPSGTEPKIKTYYSIYRANNDKIAAKARLETLRLIFKRIVEGEE